MTSPNSLRDRVFSVSEVTYLVRDLLEEVFPSLWVCGEISNLARPSSGHVYFSLKDAAAQLRAVLFRGLALRLRFELRDGLEVLARGRLSVYAPRGEYQLVVEELQPRGLGAQELALRQLREKLLLRGYFDPARKKPLPRWPRRIALVTSAAGAAVRDMLEILGRRWPLAEVWVCPVRVQGEGAAQEIAAALYLLNQVQPSAEVIIVGRGGGSAEDLSAFNEEIVADALFASRIPVVSAVGHEIDVTLADLVADRRALTPSEAAELVVPDKKEVENDLRQLADRLHQAMGQRLDLSRRRLQELAQRRAFRLPGERLRELEQRLDEDGERLRRALRQHLHLARQRLAGWAGRLQALSPLNVLSRGYSLTQNEHGQLLRRAEQVQPGQRLLTRLQHGRLLSRVEVVYAEPAACAAPQEKST
jgi:exodeoxyribonuclease VII large subunit